MQVFGHLLMRRLIAVRVLGQVVHEMIGVKDEAPEKLPEDHATGKKGEATDVWWRSLGVKCG